MTDDHVFTSLLACCQSEYRLLHYFQHFVEYAAELDIGFHMAISNAFWTIAVPEHGAKPAFYNENVNNVLVRGNTQRYSMQLSSARVFCMPGL